MKKKVLLAAILVLLMSTAGVNNVWADGDDPIPFIILPPEGEGGDIPPLPGGPGNGS